MPACHSASLRPPSATRTAVAAALMLSLVVPRLVLAADTGGAASPQALVARLQAAAEKKDFAEMAACIAPDERAEMALMMAVMGGMVIAFMGMGGEMAGGLAETMTEGLSGQKPDAKQQAEIDKVKAEAGKKSAELQARYEGILTKYGLDKKLEAAGPELAGEDGPAPGKARELLEGIDDIALLRDLMGLFKDLGEESGQGEDAVDIPRNVTDYKIDGDRATAKSGDEVIQFVKVDGRWYFKPEAKKEEPAVE